jgi:hypothetical protein
MTKTFSKLLNKANIGNEKFNKAILEICSGNEIALGHKIFKKRIGSQHGGKRGGYRSIFYYRLDKIIIFFHLYSKNEQENISDKEIKALIELSNFYDEKSLNELRQAIEKGVLVRWDYE